MCLIFNNYQCYSGTINKEAIDKFINVTHEVYKRELGDEFGKTISAIFTNEPQLQRVVALSNGFSREDSVVPWTMYFDETYGEQYGEDITDSLPELYFAMHGDGGVKTRYNYYRHVSERFNGAYMDNIGNWCADNGIMFTGHVLGEDWLFEMCLTNADVMRTYKNMQFPGIDMLCAGKCSYDTIIVSDCETLRLYTIKILNQFKQIKLRTGGLKAGEHKVKFVLYGNRYNTFSALHTLLADKERVYIDPDYWRSSGDGWAYEYQTRSMGILKTPVVRKIK